MNERLLTGQVARACGVSHDTIRHYERLGVIAKADRDRSGYRRYAPETIDRVRIVRRALGIGFTLEELARIFRQRSSGRPPCREVRALARQKLSDLDSRIAELLAMRETLRTTLAAWDDVLQATPEGHAAHLLDKLHEGRTS